MTRGHGRRGAARRATCPRCGRSVACYTDTHALLAGAGLTYLLMPHNVEKGNPCSGWRVDKDALEPLNTPQAASEVSRGNQS